MLILVEMRLNGIILVKNFQKSPSAGGSQLFHTILFSFSPSNQNFWLRQWKAFFTKPIFTEFLYIHNKR